MYMYTILIIGFEMLRKYLKLKYMFNATLIHMQRCLICVHLQH